MNNFCSNKEKINHAFQLLIDSCQLQQQNIIKRICKYIQEDINTVIRFSEQIYETFVKSPENNSELISKLKKDGSIPIEALFNQMYHASKAIDEKKTFLEEAKAYRSNIDTTSAFFQNAQ